jgi:predicted N-acetyltransferase YhbS
MPVDVRPEEDGDRDGIRAVHLASFVSAEEADLVDALRASGDYMQSLCSVALDDDGAVVGHVGFSRAWLEGADVEVLVLAPLAVLPDRQRQGVGPELIASSIERAEGTDFPVVVVLGHRAYYPRFGFEPAGALGIDPPFETRADAWMARRLRAWSPGLRGTVRFAAPFDALM